MDAAEIARRLAAAHAGMSTREAAREWGIVQQTLWAWETGANYPSRQHHVELVAEIIGVEPEVVAQAGRRRNLERSAQRIKNELAAQKAELERMMEPEPKARRRRAG